MNNFHEIIVIWLINVSKWWQPFGAPVKTSGAKSIYNGRVFKDIHYPIWPMRIRESWMSFGVPEIASKTARDSGSVWRLCLATRPGRLATCQVHGDAFGRIPVGVLLFVYPWLGDQSWASENDLDNLQWLPVPNRCFSIPRVSAYCMPARYCHCHRSRLYLHLSHSKSFLSPWHRR